MFAALHLADLPVIAALRGHPSLQARPCVVLGGDHEDEKARGKLPLLSVNETARDAGVVAGWTLDRGRVRCPDLVVMPRNRRVERELLAELLVRAEALTPDLEITAPDTILLDLTHAPLRQIQYLDDVWIKGAVVHHVRAETPDLAHLGVLDPDFDGGTVSSASIAALPLGLLAKLVGDAPFFQLLELWGLRTLGDFMNLPRQGLTERLGAEAGQWHEILHARHCRLLRLHRVPESLQQSVDCEDPLHAVEPMLFVLKRMLHTLSARLASRHLAVNRLHLKLRLESEESVYRSINLPEPLVEPVEMLRPLQTLLESLRLAAPVVGLDLDGETALPGTAQREWFTRQLPNPSRWAETLARVEALVGGGRTGIPMPPATHRPDDFRLLPPPAVIGSGVPCGDDERRPASPLPMRRYRPSRTIAVASDLDGEVPRPLALLTGPHPGQIVECQGPFPMSGQWWDPEARWKRFEWDIQMADQHLLRLAYVPPDRWQLEGVYA